MTIDISLDKRSIDSAIKKLEAYKASIQPKMDLLCERLAEIGAIKVSQAYSEVAFTTDGSQKDYQIDVRKEGNAYVLAVEGTDVLFLEYGSGITYGYGHPEPNGYGPGTFPGKGHWDEPNGWYTPAGQHTYGNPPSAGMYYAEKDMVESIRRIAREVFGNG